MCQWRCRHGLRAPRPAVAVDVEQAKRRLDRLITGTDEAKKERQKFVFLVGTRCSPEGRTSEARSGSARPSARACGRHS